MKDIIIYIFFYQIYKILSECTYNINYHCSGEETTYSNSWDTDCFQTPPRGHTDYKETYQDMNLFVGYAQQKYSSDRFSCTINFIKFVNPTLGTLGTNYKILYKFGENGEIEEDHITVNSNTPYKNGMQISARIIKISDDDTNGNELAKLELENIYFLWDVQEITGQDGEYENGKKGAIVELFGWPFDDIAEECDFLSVAGYLGVKITIPNESLLTFDAVEGDGLNPWWYLFQPVSYKIKSRSGNRNQLINMINRCRKRKIRIYTEVAINNMVNDGNDEYKIHKNDDCTSDYGPKSGSAGSPFWTMKGRYQDNPITNKPPVYEFPSVPYCHSDFHCKNYISDDQWGNLSKLNIGWVSGEQIDLNTGQDYVRQRIADFLTDLISMGITGFSMNNAKHIHPDDLIYIFKKLKDNLGGQNLPDDFLAYFEINLGNEKNQLICNEGSNYGAYFNNNFNSIVSSSDLSKIQILTEFYPDSKPDCETNWSIIVKERYIMSLENQNIQKSDTNNIYFRDHNKDDHISLYTTMFNERDIGNKIRIVFSSYSLINNANGFPDGYSDCNNTTLSCSNSVPYVKAYAPLSKGYDTGDSSSWVPGNYTRIHRNIDIVNAMRNWLGLSQLSEQELYGPEIRKYEYMMNPTTLPTTIPASTIITNIPASTIITSIPTTIIETTIPSNIVDNEISFACDEKCNTCNEESKKLNLCLSCNIAKNYYPVNYNNEPQRYYECFHKTSTNPIRFYFDNDEFKPCYETCLTCVEGGNPRFHKCLSCEYGFKFRPDRNPEDNCTADCLYYYISPFGQYKCLKSLECPSNANLVIKEKSKCIDDCKKDDEYKYQYNGNCLKSCPENTENDNYLCKEINYDKCTLSEKDIDLNDNLDTEEVETLVKSYLNEFSYTDNHISHYKNNDYRIMTYKNSSCIKELELKMPTVDFGNCYNKVKDECQISGDLIVVVIDKVTDNNPVTSYSFFNPKTGEKLNAAEICKEETITVEENLLSLLDENNTNYELMIQLTKQGVNIFNISDEFYTSLCYEYESPVDKDIALKDRMLLFYPNVTLCDQGCENKGIDLEDMTAKCDCKFNDIANNNLIKDNVLLNSLVDEALEIVNESNIAVVKCYKYFLKYFIKTFGGYITLGLIGIHLILSIIFFACDLNKIKKYIYDITQNYLDYISLSNNINLQYPPPRKNKASTKEITDKNNKKNILKKYNHSKSLLTTNNNKKKISSKDNLIPRRKSFKLSKKITMAKFEKPKPNIIIQKTKDNYKKSEKSNIITQKTKENYKKKEKYFQEYLTTAIEDMDYDDALNRDNRKFCEYFFETVKDKQVIANTFCAVDQLKTRTIKIIIFILNIILYFAVNGLFFSEDYISEVYHLEEKEGFFTFFPRSINRFFYTTIVSLIVGFIVECFFVEEKKIKNILLREKEDKFNLKNEIILIIKQIQKRYLAFIIIVFIILFICLYYLVCFNYVYPHMQMEWIKSSIVIFFIIQIVSILTCLLETILRFISFNCKSERIYKISKLIN